MPPRRSTGMPNVDAQHDFLRARRRATAARLIGRLRGEPDDVGVILPYEEVIAALGFKPDTRPSGRGVRRPGRCRKSRLPADARGAVALAVVPADRGRASLSVAAGGGSEEDGGKNDNVTHFFIPFGLSRGEQHPLVGAVRATMRLKGGSRL